MFGRVTVVNGWGSVLFVAACALGGCEAGSSGDGTGGAGDGHGGAADGSDGGDLLLGPYTLASSTGWEPLSDTKVRISFSDGGFAFNAGCNSYFTEQYSIDSGTFVATGFGSTAAGCLQDGASEQDTWLAEFFTSGPSVVHAAPRVTFATDAVTLVFLEREIAEPDLPLLGTAWDIDTVIDGPGATIGLGADLFFTEEATFSIAGPCNTISGHFTVGDGLLALSDVSATEAGCNEPMEASFEAHLLEVFAAGSVTYEIDVARLTVMRGDDLGVMAQGE